MRHLVLGVALALSIPNEPAHFWYAAPEIACDLVTADRDQWRCDEETVEPVGVLRGATARGRPIS